MTTITLNIKLPNRKGNIAALDRRDEIIDALRAIGVSPSVYRSTGRTPFAITVDLVDDGVPTLGQALMGGHHTDEQEHDGYKPHTHEPGPFSHKVVERYEAADTTVAPAHSDGDQNVVIVTESDWEEPDVEVTGVLVFPDSKAALGWVSSKAPQPGISYIVTSPVEPY